MVCCPSDTPQRTGASLVRGRTGLLEIPLSSLDEQLATRRNVALRDRGRPAMMWGESPFVLVRQRFFWHDRADWGARLCVAPSPDEEAAWRVSPSRSASNHDLFRGGFPVPSTASVGCCSDRGSLVGSVDCGPSSCGVRQGPGPSLGAACPLISFTARSQCSCSLPAGHPSRSHMAYARARSCSSLDCCIACSSG